MKTRLMIGAGIVALLGLTACGGGSSRLNKEDFIARANAICTKAYDKRTDIADDIQNAPSIDEATDIVKTKLIPTYEDELDDLRSLKPNDDINDEVNSFFDSLESGINDFKKDPTPVLHRSTNPLAEASFKAKEFGSCVNTSPQILDPCDGASWATSDDCGV